MEDACRKGDLEQVKAFVAVDVRRASTPDSFGVTPLHRACGYNHVEIAEFLIESKADVNAVDRWDFPSASEMPPSPQKCCCSDAMAILIRAAWQVRGDAAEKGGI